MKGMGGGMNMASIMKQAQKMQKQMTQLQEELEARTLEISAGGGAIKITITGKKEIKDLKIDKNVVDPDDVEMLEDLVLSAVNEAVRQADELNQKEMAKITGGNIPGMPF
jgi:DNA-binding YbaB/EbfC family protein